MLFHSFTEYGCNNGTKEQAILHTGLNLGFGSGVFNHTLRYIPGFLNHSLRLHRRENDRTPTSTSNSADQIRMAVRVSLFAFSISHHVRGRTPCTRSVATPARFTQITLQENVPDTYCRLIRNSPCTGQLAGGHDAHAPSANDDNVGHFGESS